MIGNEDITRKDHRKKDLQLNQDGLKKICRKSHSWCGRVFTLISQFTKLIEPTKQKKEIFNCNIKNNFSDFLIMKAHCLRTQ